MNKKPVFRAEACGSRGKDTHNLMCSGIIPSTDAPCVLNLHKSVLNEETMERTMGEPHAFAVQKKGDPHTSNRFYMDVKTYPWIEDFIVRNSLGIPSGEIDEYGMPGYIMDMEALLGEGGKRFDALTAQQRTVMEENHEVYELGNPMEPYEDKDGYPYHIRSVMKLEACGRRYEVYPDMRRVVQDGKPRFEFCVCQCDYDFGENGDPYVFALDSGMKDAGDPSDVFTVDIWHYPWAEQFVASAGIAVPTGKYAVISEIPELLPIDIAESKYRIADMEAMLGEAGYEPWKSDPTIEKDEMKKQEMADLAWNNKHDHECGRAMTALDGQTWYPFAVFEDSTATYSLYADTDRRHGNAQLWLCRTDHRDNLYQFVPFFHQLTEVIPAAMGSGLIAVSNERRGNVIDLCALDLACAKGDYMSVSSLASGNKPDPSIGDLIREAALKPEFRQAIGNDITVLQLPLEVLGTSQNANVEKKKDAHQRYSPDYVLSDDLETSIHVPDSECYTGDKVSKDPHMKDYLMVNTHVKAYDNRGDERYVYAAVPMECCRKTRSGYGCTIPGNILLQQYFGYSDNRVMDMTTGMTIDHFRKVIDIEEIPLDDQKVVPVSAWEYRSSGVNDGLFRKDPEAEHGDFGE